MTIAAQPAKDVRIPEPFLPLITERHRYKVFPGGRGSGKSHSIATVLVMLGTMRPMTILCCREVQNSISDSVIKLLADKITELGLDGFYTVLKNEIIGINGTRFIFKGLLRNIDSIRSTEGVDICWVEEAHKVSEGSWKVLIPTIRKEGSEIWVSFNPEDETDPTYVRFIKNPPPNAFVRPVNYDENPFFPSTLRDEMEYLKRVDYEAYLHVWKGHPVKKSAAQVLNGKWITDRFDFQQDDNGIWTFNGQHIPELHGPYFGANWGFAQDPCTLIRCFIMGKSLYVDYEIYRVGLELDDIPDAFKTIPGAHRYTIHGDNSRPETISYVSRNGLNVVSAEKWQGSVEDGIAFLRKFEKIIIHERCKNTATEARLYSYKVDKLTQNVLPDIEDKNNHCIDAIRYALSDMIKQAGAGGFIEL